MIDMGLTGVIERRLLINYRLDPEVADRLVPRGFRPQLVDGSAVAGICMIRLGELRPHGIPRSLGWRGENAAHRIAVEWDAPEGVRRGVYIAERHSASWLPVAVGGRVFPGVHRHADFSAHESPRRIRVRMASPEATVDADIDLADEWSSTLFPQLDDASEFFRAGDVGWSPGRARGALDGLQLHTAAWHVCAGRARAVSSSVFDGLPPGSAELDSVLVMRDVPAEWTTPVSARRPPWGRARPERPSQPTRQGSATRPRGA